MTIQEVRNHQEYKTAMKKIKNYRKGFQFTINYEVIPTPIANALKIVLTDARQKDLIQCIEQDLNIDLQVTQERFERI